MALLLCVLVTLAAQSASASLSLGTWLASSNAPELDCGRLDEIGGPTQTCYDFTIDGCPGAMASLTVRVSDNPGTDGTILFLSARSGNGYWAQDTDSGLFTFPRESHQLQRDLATSQNDFKVVEFKWNGGWHTSNSMALSGPSKLACRQATAFDRAFANSLFHEVGTKFCAVGQSGGSHQIAYTLTHYGLETLFDNGGTGGAVVLTSGPLFGDLVLACGTSCDGAGGQPPGVPNTKDGCLKSSSRWLIDTAYGTPLSPKWPQLCMSHSFPNDELCGDAEFPDSLCMRHEQEGADPDNFLQRLEADSVAVRTSQWDYLYPDLDVHFLWGELDEGPAQIQQAVYADALKAVPGNNVFGPLEVLLAGHRMQDYEAGRPEIMNALVTSCGATQP